MSHSFLYFTAYIITSYYNLVLFTAESATDLKTALQESLCLYYSMYNQYKYCHLLQQMKNSVPKFQISEKLLFWIYLKKPVRKMWIKIQPKNHMK